MRDGYVAWNNGDLFTDLRQVEKLCHHFPRQSKYFISSIELFTFSVLQCDPFMKLFSE